MLLVIMKCDYLRRLIFFLWWSYMYSRATFLVNIVLCYRWALSKINFAPYYYTRNFCFSWGSFTSMYKTTSWISLQSERYGRSMIGHLCLCHLANLQIVMEAWWNTESHSEDRSYSPSILKYHIIFHTHLKTRKLVELHHFGSGGIRSGIQSHVKPNSSRSLAVMIRHLVSHRRRRVTNGLRNRSAISHVRFHAYMIPQQNLHATAVNNFGAATVLELSIHKFKIILAVEFALKEVSFCAILINCCFA